MTIKKFMFVNRKAPYGTVYALESLEVVLIAAAWLVGFGPAFLWTSRLYLYYWEMRAEAEAAQEHLLALAQLLVAQLPALGPPPAP